MKILINKLLTSPQIVFNLIVNSIINNEKLLITYLNQHCLNIYCTNEHYKEILNNFFDVYSDGIGMQLALKFLLKKEYNSFNATDLNKRILNYFIDNKISFYIIGGKFDKELLLRKFNDSEAFVGYWQGYFKDDDYKHIIESINSNNPQVIIIGMGVPKQELFAYDLSKKTNSNLYLCVGNFLEFYLGTIKRIPYKFRNKGIEWLYRITQEPKRLWKRYFYGIPLFIFRVIKFKFQVNKSD